MSKCTRLCKVVTDSRRILLTDSMVKKVSVKCQVVLRSGYVQLKMPESYIAALANCRTETRAVNARDRICNATDSYTHPVVPLDEFYA